MTHACKCEFDMIWFVIVCHLSELQNGLLLHIQAGLISELFYLRIYLIYFEKITAQTI